MGWVVISEVKCPGVSHHLIFTTADKFVKETDHSRYPSKPAGYQPAREPVICQIMLRPQLSN